MSAWLVVDLRNNRIAVACLELREEGPSWEKLMLRYRIGPEAYDDDYEVDLAFYKEPGTISWEITLRSRLPLLPEDVEQIPALLDEDPVRLEKLLPKLLTKLLRAQLDEFPNLPVVILYDRIAAKPALLKALNRIENSDEGRPLGTVRFLPPGIKTFGGYALLSPKMNSLPDANQVLFCKVQDGRDGWEEAAFRWDKLQFSSHVVTGVEKNYLTFWGTLPDLERAGATLYALNWQHKLISFHKESIEHIRQKISEKQTLLNQMQTLLYMLKTEQQAA